MDHPIVAVAEDIAGRLLFPTAMATDSAPLPPLSHFEALAQAGLYGLAGPPGSGGANVDLPTLCSVVERLASGCLTTTFIWIQHNTPVREVAGTQNTVLRDTWLNELCTGRVRAGIALGGLQAGSAGLRARPVEGGWLVDGTAPYVTGWGIIDLLLLAALTPDGHALRALVDAGGSKTMQAEPLRLIAANASGTVRLRLQNYFVPDERVTSLELYKPPPPYDGGGRPNGSLALGVARRCLQLIGPSSLDEELNQRRRQLDEARDDQMANARAAASELAARAAATLIAHRGSRSILLDDHAQRLYREAAFLLVFGSRPAIRAGLLQRLQSR